MARTATATAALAAARATKRARARFGGGGSSEGGDGSGFKLAASGSTSEAVLHSSKFAIADKHGVIRDYYGATNDDSVEHVTTVVHDLLRED